MVHLPIPFITSFMPADDHDLQNCFSISMDSRASAVCAEGEH